MQLDPEQIRAMMPKRERGSYIKHMASLLGKTEAELRAEMDADAAKQAALPRKLRVSREERLRDIMEKRYGVPPALLDAYDNEVKDYDW